MTLKKVYISYCANCRGTTGFINGKCTEHENEELTEEEKKLVEEELKERYCDNCGRQLHDKEGLESELCDKCYMEAIEAEREERDQWMP